MPQPHACTLPTTPRDSSESAGRFDGTRRGFEADRTELFEAACRLDLEGIVGKRKADPYGSETPWYKVKNPAYAQAEGRRELFERNR